MNAVFLSLIGAFSFAFGITIGRRAVMHVSDATLGVMITVPLGVPFFMLVLISTGEIGSIFTFSWQSFVWLATAGVVNFVLASSLNFKSLQLIGANTTSILTRVNPLISVVLGISLLGETVTWELVVGALLIVFGISLVGVNPQMFRGGRSVFSGIPRRAFMYAIGT
ncbi:EamA family transporter, partial [Chloroflexota bacterium]